MDIVILMSITAFVATVFQAVAGFGYAIIGMPVVSSLLGPKGAVIFFLISGFYMRIAVNYSLRKILRPSNVYAILLGTVIGVVPGALMLRAVSVSTLNIFLGITLLLGVYCLSHNIRWQTVHHRLEQFIFGLVSGFYAGSTSVSGPPIAIYMLNAKVPKDQTRADMSLIFLLSSGWSICTGLYLGTIHFSDCIGLPLLTYPACIAGVWLGNKIAGRVNQLLFNRIVFAAILLGACNMLYKGFTQM